MLLTLMLKVTFVLATDVHVRHMTLVHQPEGYHISEFLSGSRKVIYGRGLEGIGGFFFTFMKEPENDNLSLYS